MPGSSPRSLRSLYMALFSCVKDAIAICFSFLFLSFFIAGQEYSKTKGLKWPVNDRIRKRWRTRTRHTGAHDGGGGGDGGCWRSGVHRVWSPTGEEKEKKGKIFYFLLNFVLLTVRLEPSVQLRMPARCSSEPAASFSSSSSSCLTSRRALLPTGHLIAGGRRGGVCRGVALSSQKRSESSSLWKPSLPARRDCPSLQAPSSSDDSDEDEEEREEQRCRATLL